MFIKASQGGYNRQGEQFSRGSFLLVFSHNEYKWEEQNNKSHPDLNGQWLTVTNGDNFLLSKPCTCDDRNWTLKHCEAHKHEWRSMPAELHQKLYACVRHVSLRQFGHFMMGTAKIKGQSVTVSGSYGGDGLPMDYEKLTPEARTALVELPEDLANEFWAGGGHNSAGKESAAMREWALKTFKK